MAYTTVLLTNGVEVKKAPIGFSWTVFCFGGWPPLFRQDWLWGVGLLIDVIRPCRGNRCFLLQQSVCQVTI